MPRVFLSHNHRDRPFAARLAADLQKSGVYVWLDEAELQVGDSLIEKISSAITEVDYLIAVLSTHSVASEWVKRELEIAISKEIHNKRVFVLPIVIDDCEIPQFLTGRLYLDLRDGSLDYDSGLNQILQRLGTRHPSPPAPTARSPLKPFAIPVHTYDPTSGYHHVGRIPSPEDGLYVNMVYFTETAVVVDLLLPGIVYEAYRKDLFEDFENQTDRYSRDLGWIEVSFPRAGHSPADVERISIELIARHNEELRWLLYFSAPRGDT